MALYVEIDSVDVSSDVVHCRVVNTAESGVISTCDIGLADEGGTYTVEITDEVVVQLDAADMFKGEVSGPPQIVQIGDDTVIKNIPCQGYGKWLHETVVEETEVVRTWPIIDANAPNDQIRIEDDYTALFVDTYEFLIRDSTGNDGKYTCDGDSTLDNSQTLITTVENLPDGTNDGTVVEIVSDSDIIDEICDACDIDGDAAIDIDDTTHVDTVKAEMQAGLTLGPCTLAEAIEQVADLTGESPRWWVDMDKNLHYTTTIGDETKNLSTEPGDVGGNVYRCWDVTKQAEQSVITRVLVVGCDANGDTISQWAEDAGEMAASGHREAVIIDPTINTTDGLTEAGDTVIEANKSQAATITVVTDEDDFTPGKQTGLTAPDYGIAAPTKYYIRKVVMDFQRLDGADDVLYTVHLGDPPWGATAAQANTDRRLRRLENAYLGTTPSGGGGGGTSVNAKYLTLALHSGLSRERRFVDGEGLTGTDGGANSDYTLDLDIDSLAAQASPTGDADYVAIWDDGESEHRKVLLDDLYGEFGLTGLTDNRVLRADGTDALQDSGVTLNDSDQISGVADLFVDDGAQIGISGNELLTVNAAGTFAFSGITGITVENTDWIGIGAASERIQFDASGDDIELWGANVGVNTGSPDARIDVLDASNAQLRLTHTDGVDYCDFTVDSGGNLTIDASGDDIFMSSTEGVRIGTALPTVGPRLDVFEDSGDPQLRLSYDIDPGPNPVDFADFEVDDNGYLTITPSGTRVIIDEAHLAITQQNELRFYDNGNYVGFEAPALVADQIWVLPNADGSASEFLQTDGAGNLTWADMLGLDDLSDPGADRILFWDDSDGQLEWLVANDHLSISVNDLDVDPSGIELDDLANTSLADPGADRIVFWDDGAGDFAFLQVSTGLEISGVGGNLLGVKQETVEDWAGAMWSGNTEDGVDVTYQDADGTIDIEIDVSDFAGDGLEDDGSENLRVDEDYAFQWAAKHVWNNVDIALEDGTNDETILLNASEGQILETAGVAVRAYRTADLTVNDATWTDIEFTGGEEFDTDSMHSLASNEERFYAQAAGKYYMALRARCEALPADGYWILAVYHEGGSATGTQIANNYGALKNSDFGFSTSCIYDMAAGEYVVPAAYQTNDNNANIDIKGGQYYVVFEMFRIS